MLVHVDCSESSAQCSVSGNIDIGAIQDYNGMIQRAVITHVLPLTLRMSLTPSAHKGSHRDLRFF